MNRFLIYDPQRKTYIKIARGGWNSGYPAEAVNSYSSLEEARHTAGRFDSLKHCEIIEVQKTVTIVQNHAL
jgi:hypothetical protein